MSDLDTPPLRGGIRSAGLDLSPVRHREEPVDHLGGGLAGSHHTDAPDGERRHHLFHRDALGHDRVDGIEPDTIARILQAVADGMQLQWILDPSVDMAGTVEALFDALTLRREQEM